MVGKFYGVIGFGRSEENPPDSGVWEDVITERPYYGDIQRNTMQSAEAQKVNLDLNAGNTFSIVIDAYATENFFAMRFIEWMGTVWVISSAEVDKDRPRILLRLGGVYNGPRAPETPTDP